MIIDKINILNDFFTDINNKYQIYETVFIEKFLISSGVFTLDDYLKLPLITNDDIKYIIYFINTY